MQDLLVEMFEALQREASLYRELLDLFKKQHGVFVSGETAPLTGYVKQGEMLVSEIESAEGAKKSLEEELARRLNVSINQINLSLLKEVSEESLREKYIQLEAELSPLLAEFRNTIATNTALAQESLDYIHFFLDILTKREDSSPTYSEGGTIKDQGRTLLLDKRL